MQAVKLGEFERRRQRASGHASAARYVMAVGCLMKTYLKLIDRWR